MTLTTLLLAAALQIPPARPAAPIADPPAICSSCEEWNRPQAPFRLHGQSFYVGVQGLSSVVIKTADGLILLDGGLPQSAPIIEANLKSLGLEVKDIRFILNSHAHYDHAGGIARLARDSGATVVASPSGAEALMSGLPVPSDPQASRDGKDGSFPRVPSVAVVRDKETIRLGDIVVTAHLTPGHTPGSTAWSWLSCEGRSCVNIVYADSLTPVSNDGFRYSGDRTHPDISETFRRSISTVAALPCDLMLSTHPNASSLLERLKLRAPGVSPDPLLDKNACRTYAANAQQGLEARLKEERAAAAK